MMNNIVLQIYKPPFVDLNIPSISPLSVGMKLSGGWNENMYAIQPAWSHYYDTSHSMKQKEQISPSGFIIFGETSPPLASKVLSLMS